MSRVNEVSGGILVENPVRHGVTHDGSYAAFIKAGGLGNFILRSSSFERDSLGDFVVVQEADGRDVQELLTS